MWVSFMNSFVKMVRFRSEAIGSRRRGNPTCFGFALACFEFSTDTCIASCTFMPKVEGVNWPTDNFTPIVTFRTIFKLIFKEFGCLCQSRRPKILFFCIKMFSSEKNCDLCFRQRAAKSMGPCWLVMGRAPSTGRGVGQTGRTAASTVYAPPYDKRFSAKIFTF